MVIGGQAVLAYGEPRLTRDIDITLGVAVDSLDEVIEAVSGLGLEILVEPQTFTRQTMVLPCADPDSDIRVDFIFSTSPFEQDAIARVRKLQFGGVEVAFAAPEDLIIHKIIASRPRDLEDVRNVLSKNPDIDLDYIRRWLADFEQALDQEFLRRFEAILRESR
jgi:hypothetical protein